MFYFSGHGFDDSYGNGYLAPYDIVKEEPFVHGINMKELRDLISKAKNKNGIIAVLDCCHSGYATSKGNGNNALFDDSLNGLEGKGRFILASSDSNQESKEFQVPEDQMQNTFHHHGAFSYYILQGLQGNAANDKGIVTLEGVMRYASKRMFEHKKQEPKYYSEQASIPELIRLTIRSEDFQRIKQTEINNIKILMEGGQSVTSSRIAVLKEISSKLNELLSYENDDATNNALTEFKSDLENEIQFYNDTLWNWLLKYGEALSRNLNKEFPGLHKRLLDEIVGECLLFPALAEVDPSHLYLIETIYESASKDNEIFQDDLVLNKFVQMVMRYSKICFQANKQSPLKAMSAVSGSPQQGSGTASRVQTPVLGARSLHG